MKSVDVAVLRSFVAVAGGATLTEAATAAFMSQPAMTRALQRLEAEMGAPLFDRVGRGLRLNPNGEVLLVAARRALADIDGARQEIDAQRDSGVGIVRLGFLGPLGSWLIPDVLGEYRRSCPQVDFDLHQDGADNILESLLEGGLDLLITSSDSTHPSVTWEPLFDEELVLVVPSGHRLADQPGPVPLGEVAGETFILFRHGYGLRRLAESVYADAGFAPRVGFEGHDLTTLYGLIGAGCGVGVFPTHPHLPEGLREISFEPRSHRAVGVAWCPGSYRSAAVESFRRFVLAYARPD